MVIVIYFALVLVGLCLGSFAGATVWRLRARQLVADKKAGESVDSAELKRLKPLAKATLTNDRSHCLHCGYVLKWYDLIPLVSWISLRGKCRHCHKPIGYFEPLIELGTLAFFVLSYAFWPEPLTTTIPIIQFVLWLIAGVGLAILFAYDTKWFLLPDVVSVVVTVAGLLISILTIIAAPNHVDALFSVIASVGVLSGLYLILYLLSKGEWVGFGDVKLGLGLGLLLADWRLAIVALFAANLLGTIIVVPGLLVGKLKSRSRVPFGPLLIAGTVIAQLWGSGVVDYYFNTML